MWVEWDMSTGFEVTPVSAILVHKRLPGTHLLLKERWGNHLFCVGNIIVTMKGNQRVCSPKIQGRAWGREYLKGEGVSSS